MYARYVLLRLGDEIFALVLHHVRIAHANKRIVVIEPYFRLRPANNFSLWTIAFDAAYQPSRIAVFIRHCSMFRILADKLAAVIVEPVQIFAVLAAPGEICSARMLH